MYVLAPSLLSANYMAMGEDLETIRRAGGRQVHVDIMDGRFVPSINFGIPLVGALRKETDLILDVHLMVEDPDRYVEEFARAGADIITVHAEACTHLHRTIQHIKSMGKRAGAALNPATPAAALSCVLEDLDLILVMSVNPGFGGQKYIPYSTEKLKELKEIRKERGLSFDIEVDGGVNLANAKEIMAAGANMLVAGSAVFSGDLEDNIRQFLTCMEEMESGQSS
ncbi:MAG TPA: ribulose-phosphate 3-epimerase [Candidatus Limivivens merdigallinarum]|uniref:Ribulose-phosphate 3-epimerase n=1 Tax=Candidatus Limivivens merdigallinarum TaxID=2840859 RepID=A0A9D1D2C7_9FIRM|nr:ribulose-phosphate 3-epimerase [Candidatus Limivivens merdigallinarum]